RCASRPPRPRPLQCRMPRSRRQGTVYGLRCARSRYAVLAARNHSFRKPRRQPDEPLTTEFQALPGPIVIGQNPPVLPAFPDLGSGKPLHDSYTLELLLDLRAFQQAVGVLQELLPHHDLYELLARGVELRRGLLAHVVETDDVPAELRLHRGAGRLALLE